MIQSIFRFHHLGLALRDKEAGIRFLQIQGYEIGSSTYDPIQKVNLIFCTHLSQPNVEIVYKADEDGPITKILNSRNELIYHTCYETNDLSQSLKLLESAGRVIPVTRPSPAVLFNDRLVSFYFLKGVGLIEILEQ